MDNKDSEAEIHPLKTEDAKAQENHENSVERRIIIKQSARLSRLSRWRTAAFFVSLFLCLIIVFAFSFVIPCPERPVSERTWFRNYDNAGELAKQMFTRSPFPSPATSLSCGPLPKTWSQVCRDAALGSKSCEYLTWISSGLS